ncbi:hypothetical protein ES319_A11G158900v1 [Gossypium barbadense]|uniref:Pentatricopeptide repeat-containing protein n=3 Tax=Gossypium TaxID=3633 RepID=A0A5J5TS71_GOSBA|nr:hypothetical protein ES319_A11G158900v1 [Gossypium barbadense]TYG94202.1 hypothetical protein ES288_A11G169200v1 [Gossypium darwinii]TYI00975.1 hypothetical protein ES332_A11G169200v1 [Gossypium tomentosum]
MGWVIMGMSFIQMNAVLGKILKESMKLDTFVCRILILAYTKEGRLEEASKVKMKDILCYNPIIRGPCKARRVVEAKKYLALGEMFGRGLKPARCFHIWNFLLWV